MWVCWWGVYCRTVFHCKLVPRPPPPTLEKLILFSFRAVGGGGRERCCRRPLYEKLHMLSSSSRSGLREEGSRTSLTLIADFARYQQGRTESAGCILVAAGPRAVRPSQTKAQLHVPVRHKGLVRKHVPAVDGTGRWLDIVAWRNDRHTFQTVH